MNGEKGNEKTPTIGSSTLNHLNLSERVEYLKSKPVRYEVLYKTDNLIIFLDNNAREISIEYQSEDGIAYITSALVGKNEFKYAIGKNHTDIETFTHKNHILTMGKEIEARLNKKLFQAIKQSCLIPVGIDEPDKNIIGFIENIFLALKSPGVQDIYISKLNDWKKLIKEPIGEKCPTELSEKEKEECIKVLKKPDLLKYIKTSMEEKDIDKAVIGEHHSSLTLLLNCVGALNGYETINTLKGSSSIGKTAVANMVTGLFNTKKVGDLSPTALKHSGEYDYDVLYLQESLDEDFKNKNFRLISSDDGGFTAETTLKDKDGEYYTREHKIPAKTFVTTSTAISIYDEFSTRSYLIPLDESRKQTERIVKHTFSEGSRFLDQITGKVTYGEKYNKIMKAILLLKSYTVIIPYEKLLEDIFPVEQLRARRDSRKLVQLIQCSAFLFQYQRPKVTIKGQNILFATIQDLYNVLRIAGPILESTLTGFDARTLKAMEVIPDIIKNDGYVTSSNLQKLGIGKNYCSQILKQLRDSGFLLEDRELKVREKIKGRTIVHVENPDYKQESLISSIKDLNWVKFRENEVEKVNAHIKNSSNYKGVEKLVDPIIGEIVTIKSDIFLIHQNKEDDDSETEKNSKENLKNDFKDSEMVSYKNELDVEQLAIDAYQGGDENAMDKLGPEILKQVKKKK